MMIMMMTTMIIISMTMNTSQVLELVYKSFFTDICGVSSHARNGNGKNRRGFISIKQS
jgi:hypothetical protein